MYSTLLKTIVLPIADKAMKTNIASSYRKIGQMRTYSKDQIGKWQNNQLNILLDHAYNHTKYYKKLFKQEDLLPDDIKSILDLEKLPTLTKEIIRNNFDDIISNNIQSIPHKKSSTGGSTGDPVKYWLDHRSWSMANANTIINWGEAGYNFGDKYIALGSSSLFVNKKQSLKHQFYYSLKNKIGLNGINMSDSVCKGYIELIKKKKIKFIYGYASSIYLLAKYVLAYNQDIKIRACFPTSEMLTEQYRKTMQAAFKCRIMDGYGAHDGGITAFAHKKGFFEVGYDCLVRVENPDQNGLGPALLTDLFNYAMPLINYKLGDEIQINTSINKDYPYNGQIINNVLGRTSDIIHLENGRILTGPGFTILFKDLPVEHYYIEKSGVNSIKCCVVKLPGFEKHHEGLVKATFSKQMGEDTSFTINYTNEILLVNSGKREYFKK